MSLRFRKTLVLVFIACAWQVRAMAGPESSGKLTTLNNKSITVNDHKAKSGATILPGSDIKCPEKVAATIDLAELGRLDMAPNTDLTLGFDAFGITVHLRTGYVVLTTNKGITGNVSTAEGQRFRTDSSRISSVEVKTKDAVALEPVGARADSTKQ